MKSSSSLSIRGSSVVSDSLRKFFGLFFGRQWGDDDEVSAAVRGKELPLRCLLKAALSAIDVASAAARAVRLARLRTSRAVRGAVVVGVAVGPGEAPRVAVRALRWPHSHDRCAREGVRTMACLHGHMWRRH